MKRKRRLITPVERLPMHHAEEVGGDSEAAIIEKPEGDFVIQTRDEEIPLDRNPEIHVHVDVDLPGLVEQVAELVRRTRQQEEDLEKAAGGGVAAEEQQLRVLQEPHEDLHDAVGSDLEVPLGGRAQADNPALYVMRTGSDPVGKQLENAYDLRLHDTPRSKHREHDPRVTGSSVPDTLEATYKRNEFMGRMVGDDSNQVVAEFFQVGDIGLSPASVEVRGDRDSVLVAGQLFIGGESVGTIARVFMSNGEVRQHVFELEANVQRQGIASRFKREMEKRYRMAGFTSMTLTASGDGRYAWARLGYDFMSEVERYRKQAELARYIWEGADRRDFSEDDDAAKVQIMRLAKGLKTPKDFADLSFGREFLLNWETEDWDGIRSLVPEEHPEEQQMLDLHDTPRSPHRLHDPRVGRGREESFKRLTHQEKLEAGRVGQINDEMQQALTELGTGPQEFEDPGGELNIRAWTALADNLDRHLDEHSAYMPQDVSRKLKRAMQRQLQLFHEAGVNVNPRALDSYFKKAINAVTYQEMHSWRRQLGDHGVRHITEDMELTDEMLDSLQDTVGHVSPEDRLLASVALTFHDIGYTAGAARDSLAGTKYHQLYSAEYVRTSKEISAVFSPEQVERMITWVETHQGNKIDWVEDPVGSSIRLSDNLALFAREKLPALFRYVPGAVRELDAMGKDLAAGETDRVKKRKARLRQQVEGARLSEPMKQGLLNAVDRVFSKSPKFTLGMLAGERMAPRFDGQTMHVPVKFSGFAKTLQDLFDLGQEQFVKLAESYGMTRQDAERGEFTFRNERGEEVLHVKAVGATKGVFKHLSGEHDQAKHGRRGSFTSTDPADHAEAMESTVSYMKQMAKFRPTMKRPEGWKYGSLEEFLLEEGTRYTDEEYTQEEEQQLLRLFRGLGTCKARECYGNAMRLAAQAWSSGVEGSYAEGIAHSGMFPVNHAFFVLNGKPVDLTWGRTREGEDPMAGAARRGRVTSSQKLLERAKENLRMNAYVGVEIPIQLVYELTVEREYYGSVFEVYGDSKFPLLVRDGVPDDWPQSGTDELVKAGPALYVFKHDTPASPHREHGPKGGGVKLDPKEAKKHRVSQVSSFERKGSYLIDPDGDIFFTPSAMGHVEMLEPLGLDPETDMDAMVVDGGYFRFTRSRGELSMENAGLRQQREVAQKIISTGEDLNQTVFWDLWDAPAGHKRSGRSTLGELAGYGKGSAVGQFRRRTDIKMVKGGNPALYVLNGRDKMRKAPGISESGAEPHAGYRLGSPPTAEQVRAMGNRGGSGQRRLARTLARGRVRRVRKDITGAGSPVTGADVHTNAAGADKTGRRDSRTYGVVSDNRR